MHTEYGHFLSSIIVGIANLWDKNYTEARLRENA